MDLRWVRTALGIGSGISLCLFGMGCVQRVSGSVPVFALCLLLLVGYSSELLSLWSVEEMVFQREVKVDLYSVQNLSQ